MISVRNRIKKFMCGINVVISCADRDKINNNNNNKINHKNRNKKINNNDKNNEEVKNFNNINNNDYINKRGPDYNNLIKINVNNYEINFYSSVLHLRCHDIIKQPYICEENNDILCYNGEIFHTLKENESDTNYVMSLLRRYSSSPDIVLSQLQGPVAFVYWHDAEKTLWFGRDHLGRRSLVYNCNTNRVEISSVVMNNNNNINNWQEVNVKGIYYIKFDNHTTNEKDVNINLQPLLINRTEHISYNITISKVSTFSSLLYNSIKQRVQQIMPRHPVSSIGILFSGGIDCMVMAAIASQFIPKTETIDLINVAFVGNDESLNYKDYIKSIPDRITSINGYLELKRVYPNTKWRLIEVDITLKELEMYKNRIIDLIAPCNTVMDFNIGSILWFGARAKGYVRDYDHQFIKSSLCRYTNNTEYNNDNNTIDIDNILLNKQHNKKITEITSPCRVLFVGIGADEQLAGYRRHRGIYKKKGAQALREELNADVDRLWWRNLGRDDRCISDWSREARHPYLDDQLVTYLRQLPINEICNLDLPSGIGDKLILRNLAKDELHLQLSCTLEKRAMQFGTRLANRKYPGQDNINDTQDFRKIVNQQFIN